LTGGFDKGFVLLLSKHDLFNEFTQFEI